MRSLSPTSFFELNTFLHASLFDECSFVWEALSKIAPYLKNAKLGKIDAHVSEGAFLVDPEFIHIGKGSIIEPGAYIKGPCWIGENCTIRHGAYIRGNVITGDSCMIGHDTEMKNSIMLNGAHAAHFAYVGDSILGNNINLGAGTKCANLKIDNSEVVVHFEEQHIPTGLRKMGAIIGDGSQIGCNAVLNPGTLLGKGVLIYPCINIGGFIDERCRVRSNVQHIIRQQT